MKGAWDVPCGRELEPNIGKTPGPEYHQSKTNQRYMEMTKNSTVDPSKIKHVARWAEGKKYWVLILTTYSVVTAITWWQSMY